MSEVDVLIHLHRAPEPGQCRALEASLRRLEGIKAFGNAVSGPGLLVRYHPDRLSAETLLREAERAGFDASLVGL